MDHAEAREQLELAAVEPDGFDRLVAGDTPEAAALAGHLAGCDLCTADLARVRRESAAVRDVIRTTPPPELRERTLAYVAAVGRDRSAVPAGRADLHAAAAPEAHVGPSAPAPAAQRRGLGRLGWVATLAAAVVVIAVVGTGLFLDGQLQQSLRDRDAALAAQTRESAALARVAAWSTRVAAEPDARTVRLTSPTAGTSSGGTLIFSPASGDLVVVAESLTPPPAGREFGCWIEVDGVRRRVGQMFFGAGLAYWAGPVSDLADVRPGTRFGVSLVDAGGGPGAEPVLVGEL